MSFSKMLIKMRRVGSLLVIAGVPADIPKERPKDLLNGSWSVCMQTQRKCSSPHVCVWVCVLILGVLVDIFVMPPLTRPCGVWEVHRKPGGRNISTSGRTMEPTFALCGLFSAYLSIAEPTLWN